VELSVRTPVHVSGAAVPLSPQLPESIAGFFLVAEVSDKDGIVHPLFLIEVRERAVF
jgi:hypothetical protein